MELMREPPPLILKLKTMVFFLIFPLEEMILILLFLFLFLFFLFFSFNYTGQSLVEIADNGSGILEQDYEVVALKYTTSKVFISPFFFFPSSLTPPQLRSFKDLTGVNSFGFRGEALSSLCALCDLSITTRTAEQTVGNLLEYNQFSLSLSLSFVFLFTFNPFSLSHLSSLPPLPTERAFSKVKSQHQEGM